MQCSPMELHIPIGQLRSYIQCSQNVTGCACHQGNRRKCGFCTQYLSVCAKMGKNENTESVAKRTISLCGMHMHMHSRKCSRDGKHDSAVATMEPMTVALLLPLPPTTTTKLCVAVLHNSALLLLLLLAGVANCLLVMLLVVAVGLLWWWWLRWW